MRRTLTVFSTLAFATSLLLPSVDAAAAAADVELLPSEMLSPASKEQTAVNQYKKKGPWRVGVSFSGMGTTWLVQVVQEMRLEAERNKDIAEFILVEANWKPAKQVADVEDLLAKKVDALIIVPISQAIGTPLIKKAVQQGIPVVSLGTSGNATLASTEIAAGGETFGRQGGEYLRRVLNGKGSIWVFRGMAGVDEDQLRYDGLRKALAGSNIKITNEVFGDWNYAKGKQLCENLVLSGQPVDGIWFSGAEMTRACIDVFKETGKPLVPMTGESNNGFLRAWKQTNVNSVAPTFTPSVGTAVVRAATSLLEGKQLYRSYFSSPEPITRDNLDKYFRGDLNDAYWMPSALPEAKLKELFRR